MVVRDVRIGFEMIQAQADVPQVYFEPVKCISHKFFGASKSDIVHVCNNVTSAKVELNSESTLLNPT